jgi:CheY-like chemotaxis protein
MLSVLLVEDNLHLRPALKAGLEAIQDVSVRYDCSSGEEILEYCLQTELDLSCSVILMDVQLAGSLNGIQAAIAIRR